MKQKKRVYISGPMTDPKTGKVSAENLLLFWKAEDLLRNHGYDDVVNPVRVWMCRYPWMYRVLEWIVGGETAYRIVLLYDIWLLMRCTNIYKLPRWQQSRGANIESCVAYHMRVCPVRQKVIEKLDKKMENIIKNNEKLE